MWTLLVWLSFGVVAGLSARILSPAHAGLGDEMTVGAHGQIIDMRRRAC